MLGPFATTSRFTPIHQVSPLYCRTPPAYQCPQRQRRQRRRQRQRVTEGTAMAPWNGPNYWLIDRLIDWLAAESGDGGGGKVRPSGRDRVGNVRPGVAGSTDDDWQTIRLEGNEDNRSQWEWPSARSHRGAKSRILIFIIFIHRISYGRHKNTSDIHTQKKM